MYNRAFVTCPPYRGIVFAGSLHQGGTCKLLYVLKLLLGCLVVSIGILILHHSHLVTGGTAGLSLSLSYLSGMPFSVVFFLINIPFYILSLARMGLRFTLSTVTAVSILSFLSGIDHWIPDFSIPPLFGALVGGVIIGLGLTLIFLNRSSWWPPVSTAQGYGRDSIRFFPSMYWQRSSVCSNDRSPAKTLRHRRNPPPIKDSFFRITSHLA